MTGPADRPAALSAVQELLDLAARTRPDLDRQQLQGAITDAITRRGWPWTLAHTARILARGEDTRDLRAAIDPLRHNQAR